MLQRKAAVNRQAAGKVIGKKRMSGKRKGHRKTRDTAPTGREEQHRLRQKATRLSKAKVRRITARRIGNQAAYERLVSEELCDKLAGGFARKSAEKTKTDNDIGSIRFRYSTIVIELVCMRETQSGGERYSLSNVLRRDYETDEALKQFLPKLGKRIADYVSHCIRGEQG